MTPKKTFIEIGKSYKKGRTDGIRFTVENYSAVMLLVLKDKFDFNTEQLIDAKTYVNDAFDSICQGYLTLPDVIDTLYDENNIDIRFVNTEVIVNE